MVDLKKLPIPKVQVDTKQVFGLVGGLIAKIPPQVQDLIRKAVITIFAFMMLFAIYSGWTKGWEAAKPQGLQLAQDTRSLFLEEIERDYNRSRKDIELSSPESIRFENLRKMEFSFTQERETSQGRGGLVPESQELLGTEYDLRNKRSRQDLPPLLTPNGDGLITHPEDIDRLGAYEESLPKGVSEGPPLLDRNQKEQTPLATIPSESTDEDNKFRALVDKLDLLEKKLAEKRKKEKDAKTTPVPEESKSMKSNGDKPRRELEKVR